MASSRKRICAPLSGEDLRDRNLSDQLIAEGEWHRIAGLENRGSGIRRHLRRRIRLRADFDLPIDQVDDPITGNASAGVAAEFDAAIDGKRPVCNLDYQFDVRWMRLQQSRVASLDRGGDLCTSNPSSNSTGSSLSRIPGEIIR
jgi:hypothetical protein